MWFRKKKYTDHREACFACSTPYQLFGAISIVKSLSLQADLYLFGNFKEYDKFADLLQRENIFNHVVSVESTKFRHVKLYKAVWQMFKVEEETRYFLPSNVMYDEIYSTSAATIKLMLFYELKRRNSNVRYVLYEDGMGTYLKNSRMLNKSRLRRMIEVFLGLEVFTPDRTTLFVRFPKQLDLPQKMHNIPVKQFPPLELTGNLKLMMANIFSVSEADSIKERVILFDTARGVYSNSVLDLQLLDKCIDIIVSIFNYDNVILKPHPQRLIKSPVNVKEYSRTGIPFEVLFTEMEDAEEKVLVGCLSTALFTPKMIFGKEPYIISLHKIAWARRIGLDDVYNRMVNMYNHKERVYAPESIDELKKVLGKIR